MNQYESTSGINKFKQPYRQPIIFFNNLCPLCATLLNPVLVNGIYVRYLCKECGFICPIYHNPECPQIIQPLHDGSVYNFINNFGEPIQEFRKRMVSHYANYIF